MTYTAIYIIRASRALESRLRDLDPERFDDLLEPQLWTNEQGGRTVYGLDDYVSAVKRLFVAHMRLVALKPSDVESIFSDLPIHESSFDRWWSIEAFQGVDQRADDVIEELRQAGHTNALKDVGLPIVAESDADAGKNG